MKAGENDPSKKPSVEPKRPYNKIVNWQEGCPNCGKYYNHMTHIDSMSPIDAKIDQTKQNLIII